MRLLTMNSSKNLYKIGFWAVNCNNNIIIVVIIIIKLVFGNVIKIKIQIADNSSVIIVISSLHFFCTSVISDRLYSCLIVSYIISELCYNFLQT